MMTDVPHIDGKKQNAPRIYHGRIVDTEDIADDIRVIRIETEHRRHISFIAGQYAYLSVADLPARPFSIASLPGRDIIEFHIRNNAGTADGTDGKFGALKAGAPVTLDMPHGDSYFRDTGRAVIALAGGMGITAVKPVIETHLAMQKHTPLRFYWGVRNETQLYLDTLFRAWARKSPHFTYLPVLSDAPQDTQNTYRRGFAIDALAADFDRLGDVAIYMSGPPQMVEATLPRLLQMGAEADFIFCDLIKTDRKPA